MRFGQCEGEGWNRHTCRLGSALGRRSAHEHVRIEHALELWIIVQSPFPASGEEEDRPEDS